MNNCKEFVLDDLMAIVAIPVADVSASTPSSPVNQLTATIAAEDFNVDNAIAIGLQPASADGAYIPIKRKTGKAKDTESDSVAGRLHTVTVTCEVDDRDAGVWGYLLTLSRTPSHLLLTFRDGVTKGFVVGSEDTWLCNTERDGGKTTVTIKIQNLMGIQMIEEGRG